MPRIRRKKRVATVPPVVKGYVKRQINLNQEKKYHRVTGNGNLSTTETTVCLTGVNPLSVADDADHWRQRVGASINPKLLRLAFYITANSTSLVNNFRCLVVRTKFNTKETGGTAGETAPDLSEIVEASDAFNKLIAPYHPKYANKYDVLYDSNLKTVSYSEQKRNFYVRKNFGKGKINAKMMFPEDGSDEAVGHIWFILLTDTAGNPAGYRYVSNLEFQDG